MSAMKLCHDFWVHVYDLLHISGFHVYNQHYHIYLLHIIIIKIISIIILN